MHPTGPTSAALRSGLILTIFAYSLWCKAGSLPKSTAFIERAQAQGWYLSTGSGFVELAGRLDCHYVPRNANQKRLSSLLETHFFGSFELSRDGRFIAAESTSLGNKDSPHLTIFSSDLATVFEDRSLVAHAIYSPYRWSPDGTMLSYAHGSKVFVLSVETGAKTIVATNHKQVVRDGQPYGTPSWSGDSQSLVYQSQSDEVVIVDIRNRGQHVVAPGYLPAWSPDGRWITYFEGRFAKRRAMLYDVRSQSSRTILRVDSSDPLIWSPDSEFLVFSRGYAQSIYGDLRFYSLRDDRAYDTGLKVASLTGATIAALPAAMRAHLRVQPNATTENPNRNPR